MHKKKVLSLSHIDLDGVGCQIVLRKLFGEITRMNIGYGKVVEYLKIIEEYIIREQPDYVFVTDLAFKYEDLETLSEIAYNNKNIKFYFIDHHPFVSDKNVNNLKKDNFTIIISDKASATKLTYKFLKSKITYKPFNEDKDLEKFVEYVNAYDIWLTEKPEFKIGFVYNELFWLYKKDYFWSKFKDNYKLSNKDKEEYKKILNKKNKLFEKLENSGRVMKFGNRILLIFIDDYQSFLTIDYPNYLAYVIVRTNGGISVRLDKTLEDKNIKNNVINRILELDYIEEAGGHELAFGTNIINSTPSRMIEFSKILIESIDTELEKHNL